jgi:hypothetical protein
MDDQAIVDDFLFPAWRGIPDAYKSKYRRSIWQQFEDNLKSAAYTTSLGKFTDALARKMGVVFLADDVASVTRFLARDPRSTLKLLREETTRLVLMTRLKNDERREAAGYGRKDNHDENVPAGRVDDGTQFDLP